MKKRIYRKDYDNVTLYSTQISNKKQDGTYDNIFVPIKFKSGIELEDRAEIEIKEWFPTFYRKQNGEPVIQFVILDFEQEGKIEKQETSDLFEEFGNEVKFDDSELPF